MQIITTPQHWDNQLVSSDVQHHDENNTQPKSQQQQQQSSTPRVSFAEQDNVVHDILPLCEYTTEEIQSCWFQRAEYNSFKRNSLITLGLNRSGQLAPEDSEHTMRGLECRTRECTEARRMTRYYAACAVLEEQARQKSLGIWDPEALSESYHAISWHAMYDAHTQGMADEQDIQAFVKEERELMQKFLASRSLSSLTKRKSGLTCSKKRNTVLSKIISIEQPAAVPQATEVAKEEPSSNHLIAGLYCDSLWSNDDNEIISNAVEYPYINATTTTCAGQHVSAFMNLNAFFHDMSLGAAIAVTAA